MIKRAVRSRCRCLVLCYVQICSSLSLYTGICTCKCMRLTTLESLRQHGPQRLPQVVCGKLVIYCRLRLCAIISLLSALAELILNPIQGVGRVRINNVNLRKSRKRFPDRFSRVRRMSQGTEGHREVAALQAPS